MNVKIRQKSSGDFNAVSGTLKYPKAFEAVQREQYEVLVANYYLEKEALKNFRASFLSYT